MASSISIPLWLAIIIGFFAILSLLDRILVPGLRWIFRRRVNRAIDELNTKLKLRIQPFKLTKRQALIDRLVFDEEVIKAVEKRAEEEQIPREAVMKEVHRYAREIVPAFNAYAYFRVGARMARWLSNLLYRVRLGYSDDEALRKVDKDSTVIFVMNHRSNMDYVLVTYMASSNSALSYAVGEWARVFMLQTMIRTMGAYFIRRGSGNDLYRRVLARYVAMATKGGVTQAIFPEGGLSRDGALRDPKFGLFSYMVGDYDPQSKRDVVFIPVGLNYDRVLEDRILTAAVETKKQKKKRFKFSVFLKFIGKNIWMKLRGRWYSYGYACVSFGHPVSLKNYLSSNELDFRLLDKENKFAQIEKLGKMLMGEVGRVVPALSVSLTAAAITQTADTWISEFELKARVSNFIEHIERNGAHVHLPRMDRDYAVSAGIRMLILRHMIEEKDGLYRANQDELVLLNYYANAIVHLLPVIEPQIVG
ncbi:MAG: glycerol-3-phosphate acyltransferase [bacterium]|nr:glycerol-3-phosphate acyltransferase [bacterium]